MRTHAYPELAIQVGTRVLTASLVSSLQAAMVDFAESVPPIAPGEACESDPRFYFASVSQRNWTPRVIAIRENGHLLGLVYTKERKFARFNTGLLLADGSLTTMLSNQVNREDVLCAAIRYLFSCRGVRGLRMLLPPGGHEIAGVQKACKALLDLDIFLSSKALDSRLALPACYEEFLAMLGKNTRRNFRRYRHRFEERHNQYVEHIPHHAFVAAVRSLVGKCRAGGTPSGLRNSDTVARLLRMLAVAQRPLLAGLRRPDGQWLAVLGGWHGRQKTTVVLQLNDDTGYPHDSLSLVLRSYVIETLIAQNVRDLIFWNGCSQPLAEHCGYVPLIAVHLDARTCLWRLVRYAVARVASWFPHIKTGAVWIAPSGAISKLPPESAPRCGSGGSRSSSSLHS